MRNTSSQHRQAPDRSAAHQRRIAEADITRSPNLRVGFGSAGPHFCLGAHLAWREITAILRELLRRVPDIRAAGEPDRLLSSFINGIKHLSCEFG